MKNLFKIFKIINDFIKFYKLKIFNLFFINLYKIYKLNKIYKMNNYINYSLINFNNLYICKLLIEKNKNFKINYVNLIIHSFLHVKFLNHKNFKNKILYLKTKPI